MNEQLSIFDAEECPWVFDSAHLNRTNKETAAHWRAVAAEEERCAALNRSCGQDLSPEGASVGDHNAVLYRQIAEELEAL